MMEIGFEPNLSNCIQTLAKREYELVLSELLQKKGEDQYLEEKLELLRLFLESLNFRELRSKYEKSLLAGKTVKFKVRSTAGQPEYEIKIS